MMRFEVFARTEVGCARERNEDAFTVLDLASGQSGIWPGAGGRMMASPGTIVAVCDGMGGAAAGDIASKLAIEALEHVAQARAPFDELQQVEQVLLDAVTEANKRITTCAKANPDKRGMGTTMTAAALFGDDVVLVQVGDSRAYLQRGMVLQQLTMDQNVVGQMIACGRIRPEDARNVKQRNMLLEAIGVQPKIGPDLLRVRVQPGDVLMLCTDGLTGPLEDRRVLDLMLKYDDPVQCCRALTEAACALGGPDNVTVVVVRFFPSQGHPAAADPAAPIAFERKPALA